MNKKSKFLAIFLASTISGIAFSQENDSSISQSEEVIVTATRTTRDTFDIPYMTNVIDQHELRHERLSRSFPEILQDEGVSTQKTANGQGSPFIRGFTGFRTLLMIDGIRLNNSNFRSGPNQYWATVDPLSFESVEVVKGPASVLHGSDAVGGAVNALTISPYNGDRTIGGRLYTRFSSAESSNTERVELTGEMVDGTNYVVGYTRREFGDVDAGGGTADGSGHQHTTGYDEPGNFDIKTVSQLSDKVQFTLAHQHVFQDDVWRTHRTIHGKSWEGTTVGSDISRIFDQTRDLTYARLNVENPTSNISNLKVTLSHHVQDEERRRERSNLRREIQGVSVHTWGLQTQIDQDMGDHQLTYGFDYYRDSVNSYFRDYNVNGTFRSDDPRGPVADNSTYGLLGVYFQNEIDVEDWTILPGVRYTYVDIDADKVDDDPTDATPYGRVSKTFETVTGSIRATHKTSENIRTFVGISQGFRAPNLSDYTRFGEARTNEIQTPTSSLDPENFLVGEVGARFKNKDFFAEASYYYTMIDDYIIRRPTGATVNGSQEVKAANAGDGYVEGAEVKWKAYLDEEFTVFGDYNWSRGAVDDYETFAITSKDRRPLSKFNADNWALGFRYDSLNEKWWVEGQGRFTAKQDRLSTADKSDTSRIPSGGTPGHDIYALRGGYKINNNLRVSAAVDNITDEDYRYHGSGQNEPGRNFILAFDADF